MKSEIPDYRSTGLTRKVLIAMHNAPTGCFIMAGGVVAVPVHLVLVRVVIPLVSRLLEALRG